VLSVTALECVFVERYLGRALHDNPVFITQLVALQAQPLTGINHQAFDLGVFLVG